MIEPHWQIENATLWHGDCLAVMPHLPTACADAIICDPPYGTTACKWDTVIPFAPMWEQIKRVLKPGGACVLFGSQPFTSALVMSNPEWFRYEWIAEKSRPTQFLDANRKPLKAHENICVFSAGQSVYNPQMEIGQPNHVKSGAVSGRRSNNHYHHFERIEEIASPRKYPRSVIKMASHDPLKVQHPTQKPVAIMEYLVRTYTNNGDTVLDFTMGSGTTGVACTKTGRHFIGIEMDEVHFATAQSRIAAAASQGVLLLEAA